MIPRKILTLAGICALACAAATTPPAKKAAPKPPPIPAEYKVKFYELVTKGYYDKNAFFRAIKGFVVQFGMNGDPKITAKWNALPIKDDPPGKHPNKVGTVTFAQTSAPNSRTTHVFINVNDNAEALDSMNFTPFGEVISGMDIVNNLYTGYGDSPPSGSGPDQEALAHGGNTYLQKSFPLLDYINKATVIDPPPPPPPVRKPASQMRRPTSTAPKN